MVIVVGPAETAESVRELNFRHEFEIEEIHGSGVSTVLHQLEQGAEHITHLVYDVRIIGNIDASLALLDRLCKTIPGISEKTIVVAANLGENSPFLRDICELVPQDHVVQDPAAELKRVLNTMLCADGIIRAEAEPEPQEAPVAAAAEPVPEPQEPPPPPAPIEVTPPSQVGRTAAQAQLVLPKPKIERSATCIAVAGAGHRIGATTQAMQICLYVKALGYKAAVIEMAASALTGYTQISDEAVLFDEHHFRVEGTDIYNDRTCILDGKSQYDYLILDYGCFSDLTEPADYLRNDILVAVCGAKPSEVELAADVLRVDNGTIHYIFSFVPQRDRPDVLVSQYGKEAERHIVSVFNLIVELAGADAPERGTQVQQSRLAAMLENVTDRRIKGYVATTTSADIRTTLNIISSALAKLLKFVDMELEQLICSHDNALDAERFIETPTAVFLVAPDENETRHFLASLYIRFLTDDLIALAERQGGHCPRPFFFFLDEFGNFPAIPGVTSLFSAIRSRGGRLLVAVQSYSQFLLKYDKNVTEIIKDNCQILLNTFVSPSAQDTASSISKMLGDETILTGSTSKSDGKTTSSHQLMGRPLVSPAQMVRIERDTWIVEKAGYAPMKTHLEGYWKYLSLTAEDAIKEPESDYQEVRLLSVTDMQQALQYSADLAPAEHKSKLAANSKKRKHRNQNAELYPGKFDT